jgi:transcriptional regulator GlxA family with amidase domain
VTESDHILCGGGVYASIDLSLTSSSATAGTRCGEDRALALSSRTPRIWQTRTRRSPRARRTDDEPVHRAQGSGSSRTSRRKVDLDELAATVGMSPRGTSRVASRRRRARRRSRTLHRLRIDAARHSLENKHRTVEEISERSATSTRGSSASSQAAHGRITARLSARASRPRVADDA